MGGVGGLGSEQQRCSEEGHPWRMGRPGLPFFAQILPSLGPDVGLRRQDRNLSCSFAEEGGEE